MIAPYGSWQSPISAAAVAHSSAAVEGGAYVGAEVWWAEVRPDQDGRTAVNAVADSGAVREVLPAPWNARSRVHEYGGGSWAADDAGTLYFVEYQDQRIYRLDAHAEPVPLTGIAPPHEAWRYGELQLVEEGLLCVRERHVTDEVVRDVALVPIDGSAVHDSQATRSLASGSQFVANARISPDRRHIAWIAWDHPRMPWDGTELRVAELGTPHTSAAVTLIGSPTESVLQPEWKDDATLYAISDRSGYWNLYAVALDGGEPVPLCEREADFGGPLWALGAAWYRPQPDGSLVTLRTFGTDTLGILNPETGLLTDIDTHIGPLGKAGDLGQSTLGPSRNGRTLLVTGSSTEPTGLYELDHDSGVLRSIRPAEPPVAHSEYLPAVRSATFESATGEQVHAVLYPPHNPHFTAPVRELPPWIAFVHGGPTSHIVPTRSLAHAFFTSRGIGVIDVNYGGSTGYGRAYRERLRGAWGIVDVDDTVAAVEGLVDLGLADPQRLVISGGSAGGWTVLHALIATDRFAAGICYYGVAELTSFVAATHDFESRYLPELLGVDAADDDALRKMSPVNSVARMTAPILVLQGRDDPIVPLDQALQLRRQMEAAGVPHRFVVYDGEAHGFRRAETITDAHERELDFLGEHLGFTPQ